MTILFSGCEKLRKINLSNVENIGYYAFGGYSNVEILDKFDEYFVAAILK